MKTIGLTFDDELDKKPAAVDPKKGQKGNKKEPAGEIAPDPDK